MAVFAGLLLTLVLDVIIVVAGATLLWWFAGTTVVDGPFWLRVSVFVLLTALFAVRSLSQRALQRRLGTRARLRVAAVQCAVHTGLLVGSVVAWMQTGTYFLGWLACFAASVMAVSYLWMLMSCLAGERTSSMVVLRLAGVALGATGVIVTFPVHEWAHGIVESVGVLVSAAILLSTVSLFWGAVLAEAGQAHQTRQRSDTTATRRGRSEYE